MRIAYKTVALTLLLCLGLSIYAFGIEPGRLIVTRVEIPVAGLAAPLRLVAIGDLQPAGPHESRERIEEIVTAANAERGDLVVLLGDYHSSRALSTSYVDPVDTTEALGELKAPLGVIAVLGNHDWWWDGPRMRSLLQAQGIEVLEDRSIQVKGEGHDLWISGVSDPVTQPYDLPGTLAQTDATAPTILLTHTPDIFPEVPDTVSLTLAGHTHGGQVYIPFVGRLVVPSRFGERYAYGHIVEQDRHLYVTSGIGTAILPVRFLTPPEIVVITLMPKTQVPTQGTASS